MDGPSGERGRPGRSPASSPWHWPRCRGRRPSAAARWREWPSSTSSSAAPARWDRAGGDCLAPRWPRLPPAARIQLGPDASSVGWIYQYALIDPTHATTPVSLRRFQDQVVRPALAALPGVAEVASVGGDLEALWIDVRSDRLRERALAFSDVVNAVSAAVAPGRLDSPAAAGAVEIRVGGPDGPRVSLGEVAQIRLGHDMRMGLADLEGNIPAVGGIVVARRGASVPTTLAGVHAAVEGLARSTPAGGEAGHGLRSLRGHRPHPAHPGPGPAGGDRGGGAGHPPVSPRPRSALVPLLTLPLVLLLTSPRWAVLGVPATMMSLGGIGDRARAWRSTPTSSRSRPATAGWRRSAGRRRRRASGARRSSPRPRAFAPAILTSLLITALTFLPVFGVHAARPAACCARWPSPRRW